jgi:hypothetical protein
MNDNEKQGLPTIKSNGINATSCRRLLPFG